MKKIALIFLSLTITLTAGWWRTYGGDGRDYGNYVCQTGDSGFIVVGSRHNSGLWILKTDKNGDTLWSKTYSGCEGHSIQQTFDNDFIIGSSIGNGVGLIKIDHNGDTMWTREFSADFGFCYAVQTSDSGYALVGTKDYGIWLLKTGRQGDSLWSIRYTTENTASWGYCVQQTDDGGYIITGEAEYSEPDGFLWLIKTDEQGDTIWTVRVGSGDLAGGNFVEQTVDGGYIVTGHSGRYFGGVIQEYYPNLYLVKTSTDGNVEWSRRFGGEYDYLRGYCVRQLDNGRYIVSCNCHNELKIFNVSEDGDTIWSRSYGESPGYSWNCIQITTDKGYIIAGTRRGDSPISHQLLLIKTDSLGLLAVAEPVAPKTHRTFEVVTSIGPQIQLTSYSHETQTLNVFDASGRIVDELLLEGPGTTTWGNGISPGVYFIREMGGSSPAQKVVLVR